MNYYLFLLLLFICNQLAIAQNTYQVQEYEVIFRIKNAGITVEGSMGGLEADARFHPRKPSKIYIEATLDPATIQTGIKIRDNHLKRSDYFDVKQFPKIYLKSVEFTAGPDKQLDGTFDLTIKDATERVSIPITYTRQGDTLELAGSFTLDRQNFGLGGNSLILSDEVEIQLRASLEQVP